MKTSRAVLAILFGLALGAVSVTASAAGYYGGGGHYGGGHYGGGYYRGGYGHYHGYYGGPRVSFGFYGPWWGPGYWGPGYYGGYGYGWGGYAPPVVVVPSEPSVYVERDAGGNAGNQQQWWYWCPSAKGYYPYVSTCAEGWQRVAPQPPQGAQ